MTEQPTLDPGREPEDHTETGESAYGPTGYLPDRAARRARKIVLRGEMSAGWPLAALAAALVLLLAGGVFLLTRGGPPPPPFEAVAAFAEVAPGTVTHAPVASGSLLLVHSGSALRALEAPRGTDVALCAGSNLLEGSDGSVWQLDGRRVGGQAPSLGSFPVRVEAGTVYVDPTEVRPPPAPTGSQVSPECDRE